jgi:hypothetical protein
MLKGDTAWEKGSLGSIVDAFFFLLRAESRDY